MTVTVNGWCEQASFNDAYGKRYQFDGMIGEDGELPQTLITMLLNN